jgi:4-hydroxy-tetrahydrodipicolinate reductase
MRLALVGYGRMGREVEAVARERGHEPVRVTRGTLFPADCPVGIDFTRADAVPANVEAALRAGARYVVGTTGWDAHLPEVRARVEALRGGLVHGANFSLGVQLFLRLVRDAARRLRHVPEYDPYVLERHHRGKRDAPSGTAHRLARVLAEEAGHRPRPETSLLPDAPLAEDAFHVASVRAGGIVGEHIVGWDSGDDEILLEHRARSRRGFARGAVLAAEWIATRHGLHAFEDVLDDLLGTRPAAAG